MNTGRLRQLRIFLKYPRCLIFGKGIGGLCIKGITFARRRTVMTSPESVLSSVLSTTSMRLLLHQTLCDTPLNEWENTGVCSPKLVM
jgi:hypothetical protein